jgi:hypothetical protein
MFGRWVELRWKKKFGAPYVHLVCGARQTGNSTPLRKLLPDAVAERERWHRIRLAFHERPITR